MRLCYKYDPCEAENNLYNVSTDLDNLDAALSNTVNQEAIITLCADDIVSS